MSTSLPERPDLDQLRRQAKELRDAARRGDTDAMHLWAGTAHHLARTGPAETIVTELWRAARG